MTYETYLVAAHRMQSAVALDMSLSMKDIPQEYIDAFKHLRVGINSAMASQEGLALLLIEKGMFSQAEYNEAMREAMVREADRVTQMVIKKHDLPQKTRFA